jgi:hypothetical protein
MKSPLFIRIFLAVTLCLGLWVTPAPQGAYAAPPKVGRPYPLNGQQAVTTNPVLSWDDIGAAGYDVYFGTSSNPPFVASVTVPVYDVGRLAANTTYFWRVDSKDGTGAKTIGDIYSFTTTNPTPQGQRPTLNGAQRILAPFDNLNGWNSFYLDGTSGGSATASNGKLVLSVDGPNKVFGVFNTTPLSGNFYAEVEFSADQNVGLALVRRNGNSPDPNNYVMVGVNTVSGTVFANAYDRQNGQPQVLGSTFRTLDDPVDASRYQIKLDGTVYSVPFVGTNKRIRILREGVSGTFHLYVGVSKVINGVLRQGWIETAPIRDWSTNPAQEYYMALVVRSGSGAATAQFDNGVAFNKPLEDRDDSATGFRVTRGEYNWSGFWGDGIVVTFSDKFPFANQDYKFVFWDQSQYIPAWHLNNQAQYSYEFHETWDPNDPEWLLFACFEPMSDRLLAYSNVSVVEDNAVRKVIKWEYRLVDPNYQFLAPESGTQQAEALEFWTFYPDGTIVRAQRYTPRLDAARFDPNYEAGETITVAGTASLPNDHLASPPTTLFDLGSNVNNGADTSVYKGWNQVIEQVNFRFGVAPFLAYSHDPATPDTYPGFKMDFQVANLGLNWSHFPVDMQPYQSRMGSFDAIRAFVNHTQSGNYGAFSDVSWDNFYQTDARGRRYREYVSLAGLAAVSDRAFSQDATRTWLFPGTISMLDGNSTFVGNNRARRVLVFNRTGADLARFNLTPAPKVVNPSLEILNWAGNTSITLKLNNVALNPGSDYAVAKQGSSLLVWINRTLTAAATLEIIGSGVSVPTPTAGPTATPTPAATATPAPSVRLTGTPFGTSPAYAPGFEFDKAWDGSLSTFFDFANPNGGYTGLDLGTARVLTEIRFAPRSGWDWRMDNGRFQGSNTSSSSGFVDLFTIGDASEGWNVVPITNPNAYRYVRYLGPNWSYANVAEIELYGR